MKLKLLIVPFAALCAALSASAVQVELDWQDNSDNENGFTIERATGEEPFAPIANRESSAVERLGSGDGVRRGFVDLAVQPETTYRYRVCAYNFAGTSAFTEIVTVTTPAPLPPLPAAPSAPDGKSPEPEKYTPPEPTVTISAGQSLRVVATNAPPKVPVE